MAASTRLGIVVVRCSRNLVDRHLVGDATQCRALRDAVVESLQAGLDAKGATIDDFRHPDGVSGSFQDRFLIHLREGEPCGRCGTTVVKQRVAGRGTYVCPRCQPVPRRRRTQAAAARPASAPARSARTSSW